MPHGHLHRKMDSNIQSQLISAKEIFTKSFTEIIYHVHVSHGSKNMIG